MSASTRYLLVLLVAFSSFAAGCSKSKKLDLGGGCMLNSDCNSPLSCTFGKCHTTCVEARDCPLGQSCVKMPEGSVCQLPLDSDCQSSGGVCSTGLVCATDQRCRASCQTADDCLADQICAAGTCAEPGNVDSSGQLKPSGTVGAACVSSSDCSTPLSCVLSKCHYSCQSTSVCPTGESCLKAASVSVCQLPTERLCDDTTGCAGDLVCAVDYQCRATCSSDGNCTTGQKCAGGVCADSGDLNPKGQITPKSSPALPDAGAPDGTAQDAPALSPVDVALDVPAPEAGLADARDTAIGETDGGDAALGIGTGGVKGTGGVTGTGGMIGAGGSKATGGTVAAGGTPAAGGSGTGGSTIDGGPSGASYVATGCSAPSTTTRYFCDDFESGTSNWSLSGQDWGPTTATARSDVTSLTDSPNGNYLNGANASATTISIDLTDAQAPVLAFWHKLALYTYSTRNDGHDYVYVEVTSDGGLNWTQVAKMSSVDNTCTWNQQVVDLAANVGKKIKIRFRLWDDSYSATAVGDGWTIDDVEVRELDLTSSPPAESGGCRATRATRYFCDGFEAGLGNWILSGKDWNTTNASNAVTGTLCLTDSPGGSYLNGEIASVTLAGNVDLTGANAPVLAFWHKPMLYTPSARSDGHDYVYVEASTDGGLKWTQVAAIGSSDNTATWNRQVFSLAAYIGKRIKIRFRLWDDTWSTSSIGDGWYVDDVEIRELDLTSPPPNNSGGCDAASATRYFCDAFENGLDNWVVSGQDWGTTNASSAVSGSMSLTESPNGSYLNYEIASATLNGVVNLTGATAPGLKFWQKLALKDAGYVEVSVDGGLTWSQLASYTSSNNTTTWSQQVVSLASYVGKPVMVRFRLQDDGTGTQNVADGWTIDYVEIAELQ